MIEVADINKRIKNITTKPGIYKMLNKSGDIIYIGKAKNLKNRITSYFRNKNHTNRIKRMVSQIDRIETTITPSEEDALLLENIQIKKHRPRFNILLRDDKSYPYIYINDSHDFPRISFFRGVKKKSGNFYGPFSSVYAVRNTINILQKLFKIRPCTDYFFKNRSRPCLQYQIKRCSAPCVNLISKKNYQNDISLSTKFLEGKSDEIIKILIKKMDIASNSLEYEYAATCRDQIESLRHTCKENSINSKYGDIDIIAGSIDDGYSAIQVFNIRNGINLGGEIFHPKINEDTSIHGLLSFFIAQYYMSRTIPKVIVINEIALDQKILQSILSKKRKNKVYIQHSVKGKKAKWIKMAEINSINSIEEKKLTKISLKNKYLDMCKELNLEIIPNRVECFDISHNTGSNTVGSCVVFDIKGPIKNMYRKFNIRNNNIGDDYSSLKEVISRRYTRLVKENKELPDLIMIDGGKGQVNIVKAELLKLNLESIKIIGVSKGSSRIPGNEKIIIEEAKIIKKLRKDSMASHLIQNIRDEAHRFAISAHRNKINKKTFASPLDDISGLGPKRKQNLLKFFGGIQSLQKASSEEISKVPGISQKLANSVFLYLNGNKI
ncbi:MAG: excinuclease ABC subunit UvrC [Pseudomonadota bacterium]|nr:excinuclease ABC subunit UvrC [Pseudomonadota bacterium]